LLTVSSANKHDILIFVPNFEQKKTENHFSPYLPSHGTINLNAGKNLPIPQQSRRPAGRLRNIKTKTFENQNIDFSQNFQKYPRCRTHLKIRSHFGTRVLLLLLRRRRAARLQAGTHCSL
jgi:hypothetical protein